MARLSQYPKRERMDSKKGKASLVLDLQAIPCAAPPFMLEKERMDNTPITARKYTNFDDIKADEYRYWQSRPAHERLDALDEMIETAYALKGWEIEPDVPRLQRPFVRLRVPWR